MLRFAINAVRRVPRAHGIAVSSLAAVWQIDLMKRALVFIVALQLDCDGSVSIRC